MGAPSVVGDAPFGDTINIAMLAIYNTALIKLIRLILTSRPYT